MLIATVRETLQHTAMIAPGDIVLVAFSGGPDSTALLHILFEIQSEFEFSICAAHMNHMLRGSESDADQLWCAEICRSLDIPFRSRRIDVSAATTENNGNMEEVGRDLRYEFLDSAAAELNANRIAVAHTADDQAETMLQRLIRGTGNSGLRGMRYVRGAVVRPMLDAGREEVMAFIKEKSLSPRIDDSNADDRYTRVYLRKHVLPIIKELNPSAVNTLANTAKIIGDEDDFLNEIAEGVLSDISVKGEGGFEIPRAVFEGLNIALQRRVLRRAVLRTVGSLRRITSRQLEAMRLAAIGAGPAMDFVGFRAQPLADRLVIAEIIEYPDFAYSYVASAGQTVEVKEVDKSFALRIIEAGRGIEISGLSGPGKAFLDADITGDSLEIRNWRPGDKYQPLGGPGHQKLQDVFVNAKIERNQRGGLPVFVTNNKICWVSGFRIAEEFKVTENTRKILSIEEV